MTLNLQETNQNEISETNKDVSQTQVSQQGQNSENSELILGKFKSVEDLTNAYKNMESQHGQQSKEIGELRKKAEMLDGLQKNFNKQVELFSGAKEYVTNIVNKYDKEQYFKNPEFNKLYQEAFTALGTNLDTDKFVTLLDNYVESRIGLHEKEQSAKSETENAKSQMQFSDSAIKKDTKALPKVQTMTPEMVDAFVAKYI